MTPSEIFFLTNRACQSPEDLAYKAARISILLAQEYGARVWQPIGDPLSGLIETILSQHTSDLNSHRAFIELKTRFPLWSSVRDAPLASVIETIRSAGLANIKGPRIQGVLHEIDPAGEPELEFLRVMPAAEARSYLRALPGVGPKTAACVLLFNLGRPAIPVDTHLYRLALRLGLVDRKVSPDQAHEVLEAMVKPEDMYEFHVNLVTHGRQVCHSQRPNHEVCIIKNECSFWLSDQGTLA
jgi:endonuclease III